MDNLYYENLTDRRLWVDGESTHNMKGLCNELLSTGEIKEDIITHVSDDEIRKFSKLTGIKLSTKISAKVDRIDDSFNIPKEYFEIDLENYFLESLKLRKDNMSEENVEERIMRIYEEMEIYKNLFLEDLLRVSIYVVDQFEKNEIVWGPGRGSSCCSYLLYLIGLHDVDSVYFNLNIDEFLRK